MGKENLISTEELLRQYILSKYETVTAFGVKNGIPSSTLFTVFQRGINKTSTQTMLKICRALGIDSQDLANGKIVEINSSDDESALDIKDLQRKFISSNVFYKDRELTLIQKQQIVKAIEFTLSMMTEQ